MTLYGYDFPRAPAGAGLRPGLQRRGQDPTHRRPATATAAAGPACRLLSTASVHLPGRVSAPVRPGRPRRDPGERRAPRPRRTPRTWPRERARRPVPPPWRGRLVSILGPERATSGSRPWANERAWRWTSTWRSRRQGTLVAHFADAAPRRAARRRSARHPRPDRGRGPPADGEYAW